MPQRQEVSLTALDQYLQEVRWISPLMRDEETTLLSWLACGTNVQQARDRLVQGYQPLMIGLAKRFARHCRDIDFLDLVQEGNVAFLQGLEKFDVKKQESSFGTFIFSWVRVAMLTALWRYQGTIRLPLHKVRAIRRMKAINDELFLMLGCEPTIAETASAMGLTEWQVRELIALKEQRVVSLDMCVDEHEEMTIGETIEDTNGTAPLGEEESSLEEIVHCLTEQERAIVFARYGFGDDRCHTQHEVAQMLGMRLYKVQELDRRARIRLRRMLGCSATCSQLLAS